MRRQESRKTTRRAAKNTRRAPRNRKKPNYALLSFVCCLSALISGAGSFVLQTPSLAIKSAKVSGVKLADKAAVKKLADRCVGQNILLLHKASVASGIRRIAEVESVKIGRSFPCSAWVRVKERTAAAVVTDGDRYCLIQRDGFMFHCVDDPVKGLPLISLRKCDPIRAGVRLKSPCANYALRVMKAAHSSKLKLDKISVDPTGDICLNMGSDLYVKFGQPDDIERKMSLLRQTLVCRPSIAKEAAYLDVSCPGEIVWKPKAAEQSAS